MKEVLLPHCDFAEDCPPLYGQSLQRLALDFQYGSLAMLGAMPALATLSYGSYDDDVFATEQDDDDALGAKLEAIGGLTALEVGHDCMVC